MSEDARNSDFFVPPERRVPSREYLEVIEQDLPLRWRVYPSHYWTQVSGPVPRNKTQGWKIHISATRSSAKDVLKRVAPICWEEGTDFKFASDTHAHGVLVSKNVGRQAGGKFITIYPATDEIFDRLLERLYLSLSAFEGPYILSDRQYKDSKVVFYRYGGFRALDEVDVFGRSKSHILNRDFDYIEDQRLPTFHLPDFVEDRHAPPAALAAPKAEEAKDSGPTASAPAALFGEFFEIQRFIKYSNAGGVYRGRDVRDDSVVIIKEARPHCEYGQKGFNAMEQLRSEFAVLQRIAHLDVAPKPLALFQVWEHLFLVQSQVPGISLRDYVVRNTKVILPQSDAAAMRDWFAKAAKIGAHLLKVVHQLHANGVVYGDLSPNNVMVDEASLRVQLIDFETALVEGQGKAPNIFTPGFGRPGREDRSEAQRLDDQYALGSILLDMLTPSHANMALVPDYAAQALDMLAADYGLPADYARCIQALLAADAVDLALLAERLAQIRLDGVRALPEAVPADFAARLDLLRDDCIRYIESHASPDKGWQLLPVDADQRYQLSFDYGVLGSFYAWHRIRGQLREDLKDWLLRSCRQGEPLPGLLNGAAGAAWLLSELGCREEAAQQLRYAGRHKLLFTNASLGYGHAGVGMALLQAWMHGGDRELLAQAVQLAEVLCETAVKSESGWCWDVDEDGTVQLGLHKGASGIALFLLYAYAASGDERYLEAAKAGLAYDMSHSQPVGTPAAYRPARPETILYPYLAVGTAGVAAVALRLHAATGDPGYLDYVTQAKALAAQKYTVCGGMGDGLAGLGHFLLDVADWTDDAQARQLALRAAHGMTLFMVRRPEGLTAPARLGTTVSVSYLSGSAGMALFLQRLAHGGGGFHFSLDALLRSRAAGAVAEQPAVMVAAG